MATTKPEPIPAGNYNGIKVTQAYNPLVQILKPMDFFCTKGAGIISTGIRIVERNQSTDRKADYNHAGIFPDGTACTLEALWTLKSTNIFEHYEGCDVLIARWNKMNATLALQALKATNKHIGQWYPTRRIVLHLFNMAHIFHWSKSLVCSEYVAKNLYKAGARHGEFYGTTPDALADEVENQLNKERTGPKYSIIFKGKLPYNLYYYCSNCKTFQLIPENVTNLCEKCHQVFNPLLSPDKELNNQVDRYNYAKKEFKMQQ